MLRTHARGGHEGPREAHKGPRGAHKIPKGGHKGPRRAHKGSRGAHTTLGRIVCMLICVFFVKQISWGHNVAFWTRPAHKGPAHEGPEEPMRGQLIRV